MKTKTRTRSRAKIIEHIYVHGPKHNYIALCDTNPNWSLTTGSSAATYPVLSKHVEETIIDEVLDLSNTTYDSRKIIFASKEFKDWKTSFKPVNNFKVNLFLTVPPQAINYWQHHPTNCIYESASAVPYYSNSAMTDPINFMLSNDSFMEATGVRPIDFAEFIDYAAQDAVLLGSKSFSIGNFIAELRDVRKMVDLFKFNTSKPLHQEAASHWLGWNFGALPFMDDIFSMIDIISNLEDRIDTWNNMADAGVLMNRHARSRGVLAPFNFDYPYQDSYQAEWMTGSVSGKCDYKTLYHLYYRPIRIPEMAVKDIFLSVLGLRDFSNIIWEAIPFSFLVDWVYNVGDLIDHWTASDPVIKMEIETFGYSRKVEIQGFSAVLFSEKLTYNYTSDFSRRHSCTWVGNYSAYERYAVDQGTLPSITTKDIGEWQLADFDTKRASLFASLVAVLT